jgi:hypothetical protein
VQQAKEEEIERLENLAESLIKEIGNYKKEVTEKYLSNKEFKPKFMQRLNKLQSESADASPENLESLEFKIKFEKNLLQKSIFDGKFMKFDKIEPNTILDKQLIGNLEIQDKIIIDANFDLVETGELNLPESELITYITLAKCIYYRYFCTGECFLALETSFTTVDFYVLNSDNSVKATQKDMQSFGKNYHKTFYIVADRLVYQQEDGFIVIYDKNLELVNKSHRLSVSWLSSTYFNNRIESKKTLIGACQAGLYFAREKYPNEIEVCDWSFKSLNTITFNLNGKYYDDESFRWFSSFREHSDKYYFIDVSSTLNIIKKPTTLLKTFKNVRRYEIDKNENLILFTCELITDKNQRIKTIERVIGFYDLNGEHKYDLNCVNFDEHLTINKDDFEHRDEFEDAMLDYWVQVTCIENWSDRMFSFFDKEELTFQNIVFDDLVSSKIESK